MNFAEHLTHDRRLVLLRALAAAAQYRANAFLLRRYCDAVGHVVSADRIEADLAWLGEQGLLSLERPEGVTVATLSARGLDVAEGRATVPGVQRPQPGN
ncbi:MAG: ArsR family transcriptional regulator [Ideonella sp.]|nr:ArsR family transcriptional regulator [Ideonella sp.]MCC7455976.1 ArsR family transcriptional regulator [Nitrospira sp.]